ncbi:PQQ-binding-like beta-propeller repeat protein [Streptomyces sp. B1I3]|uniref:outer membrane protein assembly factor BamB family protein n=1 Tax=Streptomyces sp. B1I3 TaxID=3042264 RepID=UPI0027D7D730|nr:PQQ-binding-like beta-propeller repeat protein [Streptomyces sp. B1I3]
MTQPPDGQPSQGGFGAPYDPVTGVPQPPPPGYGYPPRPGPYDHRPGPYGQQPGPYTQQSGYGYPPPPMPPQQSAGGPAGPGGGRSRGRTWLVVGVVLAVLLTGGGVWFATSGDDGDTRRPVAGGSGAPSSAGTDGGKAGGTDKGRREKAGPTAGELNAGRKPGEAKVLWLQYNDVDVPGKGAGVHGPWTVGDTVATAMYRTVSGYALADGTRRWTVSLPTDICAAATLPTADGKIVIGLAESNTADAPDCSVLQVIDLRTGKPGWKKTVPSNGLMDMRSEVSVAIGGDTVTYARAGGIDAYRISDGTRLFGNQPGDCQPNDVAGGPRLIAAVTCGDTAGTGQIQELDQLTGKPKWTYELDPGWHLESVYSADPLVVVVTNVEEQRIIALRDDGTLRSRIDGAAALGAAADDTTLYLSTKLIYADSRVTNKIAAYDLDTGKRTWESNSPPGQAMKPLRMEGGKVLVHVMASRTRGGAIATLSPGGGAPQTLLRHPASAADAEEDMFSAKVLYAGGRCVLTTPSVASDTDANEAKIRTMMVFGE